MRAGTRADARPRDDEGSGGVHGDGRVGALNGATGVDSELTSQRDAGRVVHLAVDVALPANDAVPHDHVVSAGAGGDGRIDLFSAARAVDGNVGLRDARRDRRFRPDSTNC